MEEKDTKIKISNRLVPLEKAVIRNTQKDIAQEKYEVLKWLREFLGLSDGEFTAGCGPKLSKLLEDFINGVRKNKPYTDKIKTDCVDKIWGIISIV